MGILIDSVNYTDPFGVGTSFYKSDAGDECTAVMTIRTLIRMSSVGNPLTLDPTTNQVQSAGVSWLDAGFRVGQDVYVVRSTSGGATIPTPFWSTIVYVDDIVCDFGVMPQFYSLSNQEILTITAVVANGSTTALQMDEVDVLFNHIKNSVPASPFSLIDGEVSRVRMTGISSLTIGGTINGVILGNQSGGFLKSAVIERVTAVDQFYRYEISIVFVNSGMYDSQWFFSSDCLKTSIQTEWAVVSGEPFARITGTYALDGDTGYYNEPFNTGLNDATLVQGISEIDYCVPTVAQIKVDGPLLGIGMGSCYLPTDVTYYKNQVASQYDLTMIIPTQIINNFFVPVSSEVNSSGAGYDIEMTNLTQVGSVTTIDIIITPNADLTTFMDGRDPQDRRFLLWVRCGNINLLAHDNQLQCSPPVGGPLIMEQDYGYLHHCQNIDDIDTSYGDLTGFVADTEDDVAYVGKFLLTKNQIIESFTVRFEAYNTVTGADFTLKEVVFAFGSIPISGAGVYLLNETQTVVTTLPTTSLKREATLTLVPSLDTPTEYGVQIYAPWLLDWRYWLNQLNASVDFYPTQDKNWEQYDNLGSWTLRTELSLLIDGLAYTHQNTIVDREYDASASIDSVIELFVDATSTLVNVVPTGTLMRIKSTHTNLVGTWGPVSTWGMITVEPYESDRRWICSSCVPFDNDTNNPLTPLSGLLINIVFPSPSVAVLECYFNPDLIDLTNGVKITAKIYDDDGDDIILKTTAPSDTNKTDTFTVNKNLAP